MKKSLLFLFKLVVSLSLIWLTWSKLQSVEGFSNENFAAQFFEMKLSLLLAAVGILLLSMFFSAYQWWLLLKRQEVEIGLKSALEYYFVGLFFNNFLPGNVGGDLKKVYDIHSEYGAGKGGFVATLFDRLFGLFILNGFSLGVGVLFFARDAEVRIYILPSFLIFVAFLFFFSTLFSRRISGMVNKLLKALRLNWLAGKLESVQERFYRYRHSKLWIRILTISTLTQFLRVSVHVLVGISMGLNIDVSYYFFFIPIVAFATALPISIGGFGIREYTAASLFSAVGIGAPQVVVMQLTAYMVNLFVSLFGGIHFLAGKKNV